MFNFVKAHTDNSGQYGQMMSPNRLRYQFAQRNKRELKLLGDKMSCRDFFNDAVAAYHGITRDNSYGYDTNQIKFNRYGLYIVYTCVTKPELFVHNIEQGINPRLLADTGSQVVCHIHDKSTVVIRIPTAVLKYTWRMSLLTQLIRNSNYGKRHSTWESFFEEWPEKEYNWHPHTKNLAKDTGFKPPVDAWWYGGKDYSGNGVPHPTPMKNYASTIHGNGCNAISNALLREGIIKVSGV